MGTQGVLCYEEWTEAQQRKARLQQRGVCVCVCVWKDASGGGVVWCGRGEQRELNTMCSTTQNKSTHPIQLRKFREPDTRGTFLPDRAVHRTRALHDVFLQGRRVEHANGPAVEPSATCASSSSHSPITPTTPRPPTHPSIHRSKRKRRGCRPYHRPPRRACVSSVPCGGWPSFPHLLPPPSSSPPTTQPPKPFPPATPSSRTWPTTGTKASKRASRT